MPTPPPTLTLPGCPPDEPLTDDALTGRFRVVQRKKGHRYSLDDVLTAWVATRDGYEATQAIDLGCGLGSVLLMVADRLPAARFGAVEAQEVSHALARHNIDRNDLASRITLLHGDLRDPDVHTRLLAVVPAPTLITGTPPYMPVGTSTPSPDSQKRHARVEIRGGIEAYLGAMGALLAPGGRAVVCGDARHPERAEEGARAAGLRIVHRLDAVPREGAAPLFSVFTAAHAEDAPDRPATAETFIARTAEGHRSDAYFAVRTFFGLPPTHAPGTHGP